MDLKDLTLSQLDALFTEKHAAFNALRAKSTPTVADIQSAQVLAAELSEIKTARDAFASLAGLEETFADQAEEPKQEVKQEEEKAPEGSERTIAPSEEINEADTRGGSGSPMHEETVEEQNVSRIAPGEVVGEDGEGTPLQEARASAIETLAAQRPDVPAHRRNAGAVRVLAAPDTLFSAGSEIDMLRVAEAAIAKAVSFPEPKGDGKTEDLRPFPTATFNLDFPPELMVDEHSGIQSFEKAIDLATDEKSLPGGALTAAGGWCAPSETVYDFPQGASADGMLSLPEIGIRRGGLRWPVVPDFSAFYANPGFVQTEAQAISGTTKPCVTVDCPTITEKRLSVEGVCIKVPILTNAGWPEYVRYFVDETLNAHLHWMNAQFIGELVVDAGTAIPVTGANYGSTYSDTLNLLEAIAQRRRQLHRMPLNASFEVVAPYWVLSAIRQDISNRTGQPVGAISDQQIAGLFRERKMNPQFVYDWQDLPLVDTAGTATLREDVAYPATFQALLYPAGAYFKGTAPVINLNTVYDAASLATNMYTALFTEQGYLIGKRKWGAQLVTLPVCNAGRTGAANLTCPPAP